MAAVQATYLKTVIEPVPALRDPLGAFAAEWPGKNPVEAKLAETAPPGDKDDGRRAVLRKNLAAMLSDPGRHEEALAAALLRQYLLAWPAAHGQPLQLPEYPPLTPPRWRRASLPAVGLRPM